MKKGLRTAVVTGSTKGLGLAISRKLLQDGYFVIMNYCSDVATAEQVKAGLAERYDGRFVIIRQPLEGKQDASAFFERCVDVSEGFDVLVLNAGCTDRTPWRDLSWEQWNYVMDVNVNVPAYIIKKFDPRLRDNGSIVMISSDMSVYPHAMSVPYAVSKSAINGLTLTLVKEYCNRNIRVNAILPGFVDTAWHRNKPDEQRKRICDKIALHRFAEPDEIAEVVIGVVRSTYINGALVRVDGGYCYM